MADLHGATKGLIATLDHSGVTTVLAVGRYVAPKGLVRPRERTGSVHA